MEIMRACLHEAEKYCVRRVALKIATRTNSASGGMCIRALFGIQFGPGTLPTLTLRMAS